MRRITFTQQPFISFYQKKNNHLLDVISIVFKLRVKDKSPFAKKGSFFFSPFCFQNSGDLFSVEKKFYKARQKHNKKQGGTAPKKKHSPPSRMH